ncbi:alpha-1,2-fucosyltransferase [Streptococcus thermophilus]|uniref:alpha-1,2-fucosyltransferase n=1 Tax=Streptococcus thermophilus TaxID=1308 RepID=UPI0022FEA751|nr:alpha-1,2-fucosyltransferase [Streptococcus thermophilus]MDA5554943.1 alpha-1,2-fucosyltransferase [Streptococcus thermophilus]
MIYIIQGGRAGNQLFNYAFAQRIKQIYGNEEICFVLSAIKNKAMHDCNGAYWEDSLKYFDVKDYSVSFENNIVKKEGNLFQRFLYQLWRGSRKLNSIIFSLTGVEFSKFSLLLNRVVFNLISGFGLYIITHGFSENIKKTSFKNKFIYGSFEDKRWFSDIESELRLEFKPKYNLNEKALQLYNELLNQDAICVSLRKWSIDVHDNSELEKREICDRNYYEKAINHIINTVEQPIFVVFSDDLEWASELMRSIIKDRYPLLVEKGDNNVAEKLFLMSSCKHFIIANSTFSWWAAYLGEFSDKIVVSPNIWFKSNNQFHPLILDDWIKINCQ